MPKLLVKKLDEDAIMPTVAHPGEDLGYDLYALHDVVLKPGMVTKVPTGVSLRAVGDGEKYGFLYRDRSSMASKGITVSGGVIDAGYDGECVVMLTNHSQAHSYEHWVESADEDGQYEEREDHGYQIKRGDKVVQAVPVRVLTGEIEEVDALPAGLRGGNGFGSSGR